MLKQKSHFGLALILVAAVMVVAGGVVTASNTGFKLNKPLEWTGPIGSATQRGNNWTSVPFFNPYGNVGAFCAQTGLITSGTFRDVIVDVDPVTGANSQVQCGTAAATSRPLFPGRGIRIRRPTSLITTTTSIIIVGSHNPSLSITVPDSGTGQIGTLWFAVPYHTTAVTAADLCLSSGLSSTGTFRATIQRLNAATGAFTQVTCGTAAASTLNLVLGEAVAIKEPNGPISFIPAHF